MEEIKGEDEVDVGSDSQLPRRLFDQGCYPKYPNPSSTTISIEAIKKIETKGIQFLRFV